MPSISTMYFPDRTTTTPRWRTIATPRRGRPSPTCSTRPAIAPAPPTRASSRRGSRPRTEHGRGQQATQPLRPAEFERNHGRPGRPSHAAAKPLAAAQRRATAPPISASVDLRAMGSRHKKRWRHGYSRGRLLPRSATPEVGYSRGRRTSGDRAARLMTNPPRRTWATRAGFSQPSTSGGCSPGPFFEKGDFRNPEIGQASSASRSLSLSLSPLSGFQKKSSEETWSRGPGLWRTEGGL